jgi:predicted DCC family thiol-disulfide oxidoreductase YuxK
MAERERFATWWLVEADGTLRCRGEGGLALLEVLPATRWLGGRLRERRPRRLLEAGYTAVARHRYLLGHLVPDRPGPHRYP